MLTYAADSSEAVTSGRALVLVNVALPMTLVQFKQQEVLASGNISCSNNMMWRIASSSMRQLLRQLASAYVGIRVVAATNIAASNYLRAAILVAVTTLCGASRHIMLLLQLITKSNSILLLCCCNRMSCC